MALARQIVRRELKSDPTQIIGIIREAIAALPVAARDVRVHLHPEDAAVVRQNLAPTESERAWSIVEDPVMARGGCQITTPTSRIDARLETRLGAILSELLGTERQDVAARGGSRMSVATGSTPRRTSWAQLAGAVRGSAWRTVNEIVVEGTLEPHGRHDPRGGRLRGRSRRTLPGRHRRGQADRGRGRRVSRVKSCS